jgi:tetratricopeptide repeat protein
MASSRESVSKAWSVTNGEQEDHLNRADSYAKAEPLYQRALAIREQALGPQHPLVALTRKNYARSQPLWQQIHSSLLCKREPG